MYILTLIVPYLSSATFVSLLLMSKGVYHSHLLRVRMNKSCHYEFNNTKEQLASILYHEETVLFLQEGPRRRYLSYPFLTARIVLYREQIQLFQDIYHNLWLVVEGKISRWPKAQQVTKVYTDEILLVYYTNLQSELWLLTCNQAGEVTHSLIVTEVSLFNVGHRYCLVVDRYNDVLFIEHHHTSARIILTLAAPIVSCTHVEHDEMLLLTLATCEGWRHHYTYYNEQLHRVSVVPHRRVSRSDLAQKILHNSINFDSDIIHVTCDERSNFVIVARRK
jgi:hypothetical protein